MVSLRAGIRELDVCSHFMRGLKFSDMIVQFLSERGRNPLKNAIVDAALSRGFVVSLEHPFVKLSVSEWREFLGVAWSAMALKSRTSDGRWLSVRMPVSVVLDDGRKFSTMVWYDTETKGIRYVSLY